MSHRTDSRVTILSLLVCSFLPISMMQSCTRSESAEDSGYSMEELTVNKITEHRFKFKDRYILTLVDENGTFNLRPHPGCDPNGWGSSWYAQPFLSGALLQHTTITSLKTDADGIHIAAQGKISHNAQSTYGNWDSTLNFTYDPTAEQLAGSGQYNIHLDAPLSNETGDLSLYKLASNYLSGVPLLSEIVGDTGDMEYAHIQGTAIDLKWNPAEWPAFFPTEKNDTLTVNLIGDYNIVDTKAMGYARIEPAYKPNFKITLTSRRPGAGMSFGGFFDLSKRRFFWEDNVGITPVIAKTNSQTEFDFHVAIESSALPQDKCGN